MNKTVKQYRSEKAGARIVETYDALLAQWGVPFEETDVATPYGATHAILCGDKNAPPLVLLHGVGDDAALMWIYNARALAASFRVYALDTMGGPGKSRPGARYGEGFLTEEWLDATLDGLGLDSAFVAGVSNGSYMTQRYAILRPSRVRKCACLAGGVFDGRGKGSTLKTMLRVFFPEAFFPTKANTARLIRKLSGDHSEVFTDNPAIMAHYECLLKGFNNMAMRYHPITPFTPEQIATLKGRALFVVGGKDPMGDATVAEAKFRVYGLDYRVFSDAGHGINHEKAEETNRLLAEFFLNT